VSELPGLPLLAGNSTLETARLKLRLFAESDLDALAAMYADAETMRYIGEGKTFNRGETWRAISSMLGHWLLRGYGMWAVELKGTGEMIGRAGFIYPEGWPGFELGWMIAKQYWGRGYATEAAEAALEYAYKDLDKSRVISLIRRDNLPSIRVAEKIGAQFENEIELLGAPALVYANTRG
jgi:RimJ/RimL family protein N-acetyltransferase